MLLMILPASDYDPTESSVPWHALERAGFPVHFTTPEGQPAHADERLVRTGFGVLSPLLMTRRPDLATYEEMTRAPRFLAPAAYRDVDPSRYEGVLIPGGHAPGMRSMLDSADAQALVRHFFTTGKPVAAVCHGVLLVARTQDPATGRSVLFGRRTTALPATMELSAWTLTRAWLGGYYRTYAISVQTEVTRALQSPRHFSAGPIFPVRDSHEHPERGFVVRDGNYLSARWPGDCHRFAQEAVALVREHRARSERPEVTAPV